MHYTCLRSNTPRALLHPSVLQNVYLIKSRLERAMMLKKKGLLSTYNSLSCCICSHNTSAISTSPFTLPPQRARPSPESSHPSQRRGYATVRSPGPDFRDNMNWPCHRTQSTKPTPYEIFELERGATYSKRKYYELVKIYHPDSNTHTSISSITYVEKLERYRLVVQAHEILSDPTKRRAYDSHGAGWGDNTHAANRHSRGYYSAAGDRPYGTGPGDDRSPFGNATWEDWERWYRRADESTKQAYRGTYFNHNAFASFVIIMAVISGIAQATRAGQYSGSIEERVQAYTADTRKFLNDRQDHYAENKFNADDRVRHFLEKRDPSRYGLKDEEEEAYRKHFGPKQVAPDRRVSPLRQPSSKPETPD